MSAEFVIGAGLGVLHGKAKANHPDIEGHPTIKPHEVDIAQAVRSDIQNMVDSAPGIATTSKSAEIHVHTLESAIEKRRRGKEISVPSQMDAMAKDMIPKPEADMSKVLSPEVVKQLEEGESLIYKIPSERDPLSPQVPVYEQRMRELEQTFANEPQIKEKITRDIELSTKDVFKAALNCLFGVK